MFVTKSTVVYQSTQSKESILPLLFVLVITAAAAAAAIITSTTTTAAAPATTTFFYFNVHYVYLHTSGSLEPGTAGKSWCSLW